MIKRIVPAVALLVLLIAIILLAGLRGNDAGQAPQAFDGQRAWQDVQYQVSLGPRTPGSEAHSKTVSWLLEKLPESGWETGVQETEAMGHPVRNVTARWGEGRPWILIGAHYDSRFIADQDPDPANHQTPVPGANDGASGVAVLLELARILPAHMKESNYARQVTLLFIDAEDNGRIQGWDWILGSRAYAQSLEEKPDAVVIIDMIGDADLNIYQEHNSDPQITRQIWDTARQLGYSKQFIPQLKHNMIDDHIPFLEAGIPAVDLIDFDYPYWHTVADTPDKVSAESLKAVGDTLLAWLIQVK